MEKEKLIQLSKQYFDSNPSLKEITACSDGNFFYTESDASYHFAKNKVQKYVIKRSDLDAKKVVKKVIKNDLNG